MGKLDGKVALVTGASRGIGKAIAQILAAEGAHVACSARTLTEGSSDVEGLGGSLESTVAEIQQAGGSALAVQSDLSKVEDCSRIVDTARRELGPIDVLVNNAVITWWGPIKDFPFKTWMRDFAVDVHAPFLLSQKVLPDTISRGGGAIVNITSWIAAGPGRGPYSSNPGMGSPGMGETAYGVVKAALERFTQGLAQEVYPHGISVTAVSPSQAVPTPQLVHFGASNPDDPNAEPVEMMARAALLLATEPLDKVTGRVTYSQMILQEFGWIEEGNAPPIQSPFSER